MSNLSQDQEALKASITKSAAIWGIILGALIGGVVYMLNDEFAGPMRAAIGGGVFVVVAGLIFVWRKKANSAAATCGKCSATFSISRTDRAEDVLSSEPKETRIAQPDYSTKVTTWLEEVVEVTDTYTCAKCGDTETKVSQRTVKKDEKEEIEPAPVKNKPKEDEGGFFSAAKDGGEKKVAGKDGGLKKTAGKDGGLK